MMIAAFSIKTFLAAVAVIAVVIGVMAVGVIFGKSPLKGSCGGKGGPECVCDEFERQKCKAKAELLNKVAEKRRAKREAAKDPLVRISPI